MNGVIKLNNGYLLTTLSYTKSGIWDQMDSGQEFTLQELIYDIEPLQDRNYKLRYT